MCYSDLEAEIFHGELQVSVWAAMLGAGADASLFVYVRFRGRLA